MFPRRPFPCPRLTIYPLSKPQWRPLHTSRASLAEHHFPDHYETLEVPHNATAKEIKHHFYTLSKKHHPDHNPGDESASARFVKISNAYAVIGNAEKRGLYDRDYHRLKAKHSDSPAYTYRGPAGGRPASGLSRRRTPFKGPPPSYHRNTTARPAEATGGGAPGAGSQAKPGTGFGGATGRNDDVKHFDFKGHERTHQTQEDRWRERAHLDAIKRARESRDKAGILPQTTIGGGGFFTLLFAISGTLLTASLLTGVSLDNAKNGQAEKK